MLLPTLVRIAQCYFNCLLQFWSFLSIYGLFSHSSCHCPSSLLHFSFVPISLSLVLSLPSCPPCTAQPPLSCSALPQCLSSAMGAGMGPSGRLWHVPHTWRAHGWKRRDLLDKGVQNCIQSHAQVALAMQEVEVPQQWLHHLLILLLWETKQNQVVPGYLMHFPNTLH